MFSSLASFIFGTTFSTNPSSEVANQINQTNQNQVEIDIAAEPNLGHQSFDTEQAISVGPSITGEGPQIQTNTNISNNNNNNNNSKCGRRQAKRNKNKRNKQGYNKNKTEDNKESAEDLSITKLLNPKDNNDDELDEDEWFIVSKDDELQEEGASLPCTDSEDEISVVEIKPKSLQPLQPIEQNNLNQNDAAQRRRHHHINQNLNINNNSDLHYNGPRPQQYRSFLCRNRHANVRVNAANPATIISEEATITNAINTGENVTQSLCIVGSINDERNDNEVANTENGANALMEESWFITPPPCFTSMGPINMVTSPFENLLIEHPSMSVYHSIKSAQEAFESFVNLDLGVQDDPIHAIPNEEQAISEENNLTNNEVVGVQQTNRGNRLDGYSLAQAKQDVLARNNQRKYDVKNRQNYCRGAIKRANMARDYQSKGHRPRRADLQHCKVISGANNNRKSCF